MEFDGTSELMIEKHLNSRDFVLTRVDSALLDNTPIEEHELISKDKQWQRIVELELIPHPSLKYPSAVMRDYGMTDGQLHLDVRAALQAIY